MQGAVVKNIRRKGYYMSMSRNAKEIREDKVEDEAQVKEECGENPSILEEIIIEELAVDGICGIY